MLVWMDGDDDHGAYERESLSSQSMISKKLSSSQSASQVNSSDAIRMLSSPFSPCIPVHSPSSPPLSPAEQMAYEERLGIFVLSSTCASGRKCHRCAYPKSEIMTCCNPNCELPGSRAKGHLLHPLLKHTDVQRKLQDIICLSIYWFVCAASDSLRLI